MWIGVITPSSSSDGTSSDDTRARDGDDYVTTRTTEPQGLTHVDLAGVTVDVLNGNGRAGEASSAAEWVKSMGTTVGEVGDAGSFEIDRTSVEYPPGDRPVAEPA